MNLAFEVALFIPRNAFFTCRKILRHEADGFTSPPKEGVLRIFIALKYASPRPGLKSRTLGSTAGTLKNTPPKRLSKY
jgi:hypothetical protein